MYACESGNADCVMVLLENGASLNCSVSIVLILSISCILCTPRYSLKIICHELQLYMSDFRDNQ